MWQRQMNYCSFSKALPALGHISNILTMLSGAGITYMGLIITTSNKDNHSSVFSEILGISGTTLHSIIAVGMYIYSDATKMLTDMGLKLDQIFCKANMHDHYVRLNGDNARLRNTNFTIKLVTLLICCAVVANVTISSIIQYQQSILLLNKYLDLFPEMSETEKERTRVALRLAVADMYTIFSAYAFLAFQGSFATKLINHLIEISAQRPNSLPENLESRNNLLFQYRPFRQQAEDAPLGIRFRLRATNSA